MRGPVVLLGGGGFIGTALARELARRGYRVRVVSRRAPPELPRGVRWHRGAIDSRRAVQRALKGAACVFHLACESVPGTGNAPAIEARDNLLPSLRLLQWLPQLGDARLVFVSSGGTIYGDRRGARAGENHPTAPLSYYAAGKAALESFLGAFARLHRRDVILLRPANVYGPGQKPAAGFGVVPALLRAAARRRPFVSFGSGDAVRDYLYIDDLVALCLRLLRAPAREGIRIYNAGSGRGCSLNQLIATTERVTGRRIERLRQPARRGDVQRIVLDSRRAQRELRWRPAVALPEGLARTWRWYTTSPR